MVAATVAPVADAGAVPVVHLDVRATTVQHPTPPPANVPAGGALRP
jgi:hypothetical protein